MLCCIFPVIYYCCVRLLCSIAFSVNHVPRGFREAMQHISMMTADKSKPSDMAAKTPSAQKCAGDLAGRWSTPRNRHNISRWGHAILAHLLQMTYTFHIYGAFIVRPQKCFVDCQISLDFPSACGRVDNDWNFIFGLTYHLMQISFGWIS